MMTFEGFTVFFALSVSLVFLCLVKEDKLIEFENRIILSLKARFARKHGNESGAITVTGNREADRVA